jgi:hypothetical protein
MENNTTFTFTASKLTHLVARDFNGVTVKSRFAMRLKKFSEKIKIKIELS